MPEDIEQQQQQAEQQEATPEAPVPTVKDTPEYKALLDETIQRRQEIKKLKDQLAQPVELPKEVTDALAFVQQLKERDAQQRLQQDARSQAIELVAKHRLPETFVDTLMHVPPDVRAAQAEVLAAGFRKFDSAASAAQPYANADEFFSKLDKKLFPG